MRMFMLVLALLVLGLVLMPSGHASEFDKKTILTFPDPVQVPGVVLDPGTYVVKRADPGGNPDIIRFLNKDENHVFATVKAIPTERPRPMDKVTVVFSEVGAGVPHALKKWYYPGEITGEEFLYTKGYPMMAKANEAENNVSTAPVSPQPEAQKEMNTEQNQSATTEEQQPTESAQARNPEPAPQAQPTPAPQNTAPPEPNQNANTSLPKTASNIPLLALAGFGALGFGVGLMRLCKQSR